MDNINNDYYELLEEYRENRKELKKMINEIELLKASVENMFPKSLDVRNKFILEEKIKIVVSFFDSILKMRQEINKSIKDEIELKRKIEKEFNNDEFDDELTLEQLRKIHKKIV